MPGSSGDEIGYLTPTIAQEIAGDTSAIIGLNIIITDADGIVLGSGDQTRVGTFHEASVDVVARRQVESHDAEQAARLEGVRPGMTLPIVHKDTVVGTVGITGAPHQVSRFGQLVKRQTEILLEESVLVRSRMTRERILEALLRDLLDYDPNYPADTADRARGLDIDLDLARRVVVFEVVKAAALDSASSSPLRLLRESYHHVQDISCALSPQRLVLLLREHGTAEPRRGNDLLELTADRIGRSVGGECLVGVGGIASHEQEIGQAYTEALTAIRLGTATGRRSPHFIADLRTEQLLLSVPPHVRERVAADTVGPLVGRKDWATIRSTVIAWVESGFVLVSAARELGIHRNSLVYRLERIVGQADGPMDDRRHWLGLYLACLADRIHPTESGRAD